MLRRVSLLALVSIAGCASATVDGGTDDNVDAARIDAPPGDIDAPPGTIDAPPVPIDAPAIQTITLSQGPTTITADNSLACTQTATGYTSENSYYRAFRLADHGVNTAFTATRVDLGVENAVSGTGGSQSVQVKLYTVSGAFPAGVLTQIAGQIVTVNNTTSGITIPVTMSPPGVAAAGSTLVAEVYVPDGRPVGNTFFIGSNTAAETGPSYIRAPDCSATNPVTFASTGNPGVHIVLTVTGTY